jgi:hypothetical protein
VTRCLRETKSLLIIGSPPSADEDGGNARVLRALDSEVFDVVEDDSHSGQGLSTLLMERQIGLTAVGERSGPALARLREIGVNI